MSRPTPALNVHLILLQAMIKPSKTAFVLLKVAILEDTFNWAKSIATHVTHANLTRPLTFQITFAYQTSQNVVVLNSMIHKLICAMNVLWVKPQETMTKYKMVYAFLKSVMLRVSDSWEETNAMHAKNAQREKTLLEMNVTNHLNFQDQHVTVAKPTMF